MDVKFLIAGDRAVSVEFGSVISLEVNAKVRALDENMEEFEIEGEELLARAFCHEIDHLDGKLYTRLVEGEVHDVNYEEEE